MNIGIKPLGRGAIISPQIQKENDALCKLRATLGNLDSDGKKAAESYRAAYLVYLDEMGIDSKKLRGIFAALEK